MIKKISIITICVLFITCISVISIVDYYQGKQLKEEKNEYLIYDYIEQNGDLNDLDHIRFKILNNNISKNTSKILDKLNEILILQLKLRHEICKLEDNLEYNIIRRIKKDNLYLSSETLTRITDRDKSRLTIDLFDFDNDHKDIFRRYGKIIKDKNDVKYFYVTWYINNVNDFELDRFKYEMDKLYKKMVLDKKEQNDKYIIDFEISTYGNITKSTKDMLAKKEEAKLKAYEKIKNESYKKLETNIKNRETDVNFLIDDFIKKSKTSYNLRYNELLILVDELNNITKYQDFKPEMF